MAELSGTYKVLTIWQPYASMIAIGAKSIETRGWPVRYRGPILIHAAKRWDEEREHDCRRATDLLREHQFDPEKFAPGIAAMTWGETLGKVLAIAMLHDCQPIPDQSENSLEAALGGFGPGRYGWFLKDVRPLESPVSVRGAQGLFEVTF